MRHMGVPFEYELEAFDLGPRLSYLPDFYLPNQDAFLEVKSPAAEPIEWSKIHELSIRSGKRVYVISQSPSQAWADGQTHYDYDLGAFCAFPDGGEDLHYIWCECPHCGRCELQFDGRADRIRCNCRKSPHGDKGYNHDTDRIRGALSIAANWRFEESAIGPTQPYTD